jgi:hypothetical protein
MTQTALPLETLSRSHPVPSASSARPQAATPDVAFDAEGWRIGWEHARHGIAPPADHLHPGHPVREGWQAGRDAFGARALAPTRAARLWLQLRLQCWLRGRAFDALLVTPRLVARIDVARCPVTREPLREPVGAPAPTDAVVLPLCPAAAVSAGHLAVVSRRAAEAAAGVDAAQAWVRARERAQRAGGRPSAPGEAMDLDPPAWLRLATLLALVAPADPAAWPAGEALHLLPPPRLCVLNPVAGLQALLTQLFAAPAYGRRMGEVAALLPQPGARRAYFQLMSALLARRMSARPGTDAAQLREVLEDAWAHPVVRGRWQALAQALGVAGCARLLRLAAGRGLAAGTRWLEDGAATEGWGLGQGGRATWVEAGGPGERPAHEPVVASSAGSAGMGEALAAPAWSTDGALAARTLPGSRGAAARAGAPGSRRRAGAVPTTLRIPSGRGARSAPESGT